MEKIIERSLRIREQYQALERIHHGSVWTVEEDALAFLTDAAVVGRLTMAQQGRWPQESETPSELPNKIGESVWWLIVLAHRMDIDIHVAVEEFLTKTEKLLNP